MDIVDEQLDTTARAFMGLTVGCARCHDHKFDPIPQADYYSLAGIFKSSKTMENFKVVAKWHEYVLAPKEDRDRLAAHEAQDRGQAQGDRRHHQSGERETRGRGHEPRSGAYLLAAGARAARSSRSRSRRVEIRAGCDRPRARRSFDAGNVPRTLEKKKAERPQGRQRSVFRRVRNQGRPPPASIRSTFSTRRRARAPPISGSTAFG